MTFLVTLWNANFDLCLLQRMLLESSICSYFMLFLSGMKTIRNDGQTYIGEILDLSRLVD